MYICLNVLSVFKILLNKGRPHWAAYFISEILRGTFRQAQKIVACSGVVFSFEIFVASTTDCNYNVYLITSLPNIKEPFIRLNGRYGFTLAYFPTSPVCVNTSNVHDPFMNVSPVRFVDTSDLM